MNAIVFMPLTNGGVTVLDYDDWRRLGHVAWYRIRKATSKTVYAAGYLHGRPAIALHRAVLDAPSGHQVDHIDRNGLNNRRSNLRLCDHRQNQANTGAHRDSKSGVRGVSWNKRLGKWQAFAKVGGRNRYLGSFDTTEAAATAYDQATRDMHGAFAFQNRRLS